MRWPRVVLVLIALGAHVSAVSAGDDARGRADALFDQGKAYYEANQFRQAIEKFGQAYELVRDPVYLFNIAQSYRNAADCEHAFEFYTRFLSEDPDAPNAASVRGWIAELRPCADRIKQLEERAAVPGSTTTAPVAATPAPPSASPSTTIDRGATLRMAGAVTMGVGGLGLLVGIVYGVKSEGYQNEIAAACTLQCQWEDLQAKHDAGERANTLSWIGYLGGGVALGVGVGLYVVGTTRVERITVAPTAGGAQVSALVRF